MAIGKVWLGALCVLVGLWGIITYERISFRLRRPDAPLTLISLAAQLLEGSAAAFAVALAVYLALLAHDWAYYIAWPEIFAAFAGVVALCGALNLAFVARRSRRRPAGPPAGEARTSIRA